VRNAQLWRVWPKFTAEDHHALFARISTAIVGFYRVVGGTFVVPTDPQVLRIAAILPVSEEAVALYQPLKCAS